MENKALILDQYVIKMKLNCIVNWKILVSKENLTCFKTHGRNGGDILNLNEKWPVNNNEITKVSMFFRVCGSNIFKTSY